MKDREANIPPAAKTRLAEAIRRLVDLYTAWDRPEEATKWQLVLEAATGAEKLLPKTDAGKDNGTP